LKTGVKLKKIKSLIVNLHKFKIKGHNEKTLKFGVDVEVFQGQNCIKLKVQGQLGMQLKEIKSRRTRLKFY
jgi:hypothetical protein